MSILQTSPGPPDATGRESRRAKWRRWSVCLVSTVPAISHQLSTHTDTHADTHSMAGQRVQVDLSQSQIVSLKLHCHMSTRWLSGSFSADGEGQTINPSNNEAVFFSFFWPFTQKVVEKTLFFFQPTERPLERRRRLFTSAPKVRLRDELFGRAVDVIDSGGEKWSRYGQWQCVSPGGSRSARVNFISRGAARSQSSVKVIRGGGNLHPNQQAHPGGEKRKEK